MTDSWMRMMERFGQSLTVETPQVGDTPVGDGPSVRPATPMGDSSSLTGWLSNFSSSLADRGRLDPSVPHEGAQYNPGMESYQASTEMFPGSGTGRDQRIDPITPEETAASRQAIKEFGQAALFGPDRSSWVPGVDDAPKFERLLRDWGLSEQELRLSVERFSEGRIPAGIGWGGLGIAAALPVVGWAGRGIVKGGRAASRVAGKADDVAAASRTTPPPRDVDPLLKEMDDLWHSQDVQLDWMWGYGDATYDAAGIPLGTQGNRYSKFFDELENLHPGLEEFATSFAESFENVYQYRVLMERVLRDGGPLPFPDPLAYPLTAGLRALEVAPPTRSEIFRGMRVTADEAAAWQPGVSLDLPMSSFSYKQNEVWQYMGAAAGDVNVMFVVREGASALPMGSLTRSVAPLIGEVTTAGTFRIVNVTTRTSPETRRVSWAGDYLEVTLEQVAPFKVRELRNGETYVDSVLGTSAERAAVRAEQLASEGRSPLLREGADSVPGDWLRSDAAEVPTDWLSQFAEFDRAASPRSDLGELARSISTEGFNDPMILEIGRNGYATLIEGNHRIVIAQQLGLENVPVRVVISRSVPETNPLTGRPNVGIESPGGTVGDLMSPYDAWGDLVPPAITDTPNLNRIGREVAGPIEGGAAGARAEAVSGSKVSRDLFDEMAEQARTRNVDHTLPAERVESIPIGRRFYAEVVHRQGFDAPPVKVSSTEFDALLANTDEYQALYRGVSDGGAMMPDGTVVQRSASSFADEFVNGDLFIGGGVMGPGIYMSPNRNYALQYGTYGSPDPVLLAAVIPNNLKILRRSDDGAQAALDSFKSDRSGATLSEFFAMRGYHGMQTHDPDVWVIFDRSALIVPDYDFTRGLR